MATHTFIDITPAGLAAKVNAYLATLAATAYFVNQVSVILGALQRRGVGQLQATISISTAGSPGALATPFTLQFVQAANADAFDLATAAVIALPGSAFSTGWRLISDVRDPGNLPLILGWALTNSTAGASANYVNT